MLVATAPTGALAWEPPYAMGVAPEMAKRQKKKEKKGLRKPQSGAVIQINQHTDLIKNMFQTKQN